MNLSKFTDADRPFLARPFEFHGWAVALDGEVAVALHDAGEITPLPDGLFPTQNLVTLGIALHECEKHQGPWVRASDVVTDGQKCGVCMGALREPLEIECGACEGGGCIECEGEGSFPHETETIPCESCKMTGANWYGSTSIGKESECVSAVNFLRVVAEAPDVEFSHQPIIFENRIMFPFRFAGGFGVVMGLRRPPCQGGGHE